MKKLIMAIAVVACATFANAAAIKWTSGGLVDHTGTLLKNSTLYTAQVYFYTDNMGTVDVSSSFVGTLTDTSADKAGVYSGTTADTMKSGTYYTKIVITGNKGTAGEGWSLTSDLGAVTYDKDATSDLSINYLKGTNLGGVALINNSGTNYGWTNVPEPTSGLLLLLGMAGLALRRRRA